MEKNNNAIDMILKGLNEDESNDVIIIMIITLIMILWQQIQ